MLCSRADDVLKSPTVALMYLTQLSASFRVQYSTKQNPHGVFLCLSGLVQSIEVHESRDINKKT